MMAQEVSRGPCRERVHPIAHNAETHKGKAEAEDLPMHSAARWIDELRQEGEEENRRLRVEDIDHKAVAKNAPERFRRHGRGLGSGHLRHECANADPDQIGRAEPESLHGSGEARPAATTGRQ